MSQVSKWLGPPAWNTMMTLRFSVAADFAIASWRSKSTSSGPPKKTAPERRNERRFMAAVRWRWFSIRRSLHKQEFPGVDERPQQVFQGPLSLRRRNGLDQ